MSIFKSDPTTITITEDQVTIHNGSDKPKSIRGNFVINAEDITDIRRHGKYLRVHTRSMKPEARAAANDTMTDRYTAPARNEDEAKKIHATYKASTGQTVPVAKDPATFRDEMKAAWAEAKSDWNDHKDEKAAHVAHCKENNIAIPPKFYEKSNWEFGGIRVNTNRTVTCEGQHYSIVGAVAGVDMDLANNKKFGKGRLATGAVAAPLIGILAAPALIRKQKGMIVLEIGLADGRIIRAAGKSNKGGRSDAQKVVMEVTKMAGVA